MKKEILIIAYKFPPYSEVGAYRWTKFAKYFAESGIKVHVVTVNWKKSTKQSWFDDLDHSNIKIYRIRSGYIHQYKYKKYSDNITGKIFRKIRNQVLKVSYIRNYIDEAQHWGKYLIPACEKIIYTNKIKYIIATGGPFMANYWAAVLKNKISGIKFIQDFRDEWYEDDRFKSKIQCKKNNYFRNYSLNNCNGIVTVSNGLINYFKKYTYNKKVKFGLIYNGFDSLDSTMSVNYNQSDKDFSFIYAGSLSNVRDKVLTVFLDVINENIKKIDNIRIILFSSVNNMLKNKYKELITGGNLIIKDYIPQEELFEEIKKSFCALHFMPETQKFIISIKLFEYAMLKRPVLSINYGGDTEELINKHKLGFSIKVEDKENIKKTVLDLYNLWKKNPDFCINPENINNFSYKNLACNYIDFIENL